MKKLLPLALFLCVLCLSFACADSSPVVSDGSPLEFDHFTLTPEAGMIYVLGEQTPGKTFLTIYPYAASGDTATNVNFVYQGHPFDESTDYVDAHKEQIKDGVIKTAEAYGYLVTSLDYSDTVGSVLGGKPCVYFDGVTSVEINGNPLTICQRGYFLGSIGFEVSVTAADMDTVALLSEQLDPMLKWK